MAAPGTKSVVPHRLRAALPLLVAADVALLVAAQLLHGASTQVSGEAPMGMLKPHVASEDNLPSAARRLWGAQAWVSVAIVLGLSGAWPYVKLLTTLLFVGLADAGRMRRADARLALLILEALGKYSFADVFLICCNSVIFNISTGGKYRIMGLFQLELELWMQLHFASVALIMAVTFSAFLTHWSVYELSRPLPGGRSGGAAAADEEASLRAPLLGHSKPASALTEVVCRWRCWAVMLASLAGAALLALSLRLPLITVDRRGFLGALIRPESDRLLELSVTSICCRMLHAASERGGDMYNVILVVFFFGLTFAAPLVEFLLLAVGGASRLARSPGVAAWAHSGAEWAHSFGCVDVLLIVALALVTELHTVVSFNLGDECKPFEPIMADKRLLTVAGLGFAASPTCFDPVPRFAEGSLAMLAVVALRFAAWRCHEGLTGAAVKQG